MLISFGLRHLEDQPVAVHLCGHHPDAGANPRIRSNPYTTSLDAIFVCWWYTACMALTSANVTADVDLAVSGPHMVRILVVG
ncbi:hypothetical protein [Streptomyces sp. NRRL S-337]|uniref:hypothetical protein n=1 Tax=Streptomyces sp. NRRL S-337 TaxID=1463900 RepID=UPI0004C63772|nr:hypothetical protein [Streptomyces sp. NRRL S-337]